MAFLLLYRNNWLRVGSGKKPSDLRQKVGKAVLLITLTNSALSRKCVVSRSAENAQWSRPAAFFFLTLGFEVVNALLQLLVFYGKLTVLGVIFLVILTPTFPSVDDALGDTQGVGNVAGGLAASQHF